MDDAVESKDLTPSSVDQRRKTASGLNLQEAKQLVRDDVALPAEVRHELLTGLWGRTDGGWFVVCLGRNHELIEQGVGLVLWLNGWPFVINPAWLRPKSSTSDKPDVVLSAVVPIKETERCTTDNHLSVDKSLESQDGLSDECCLQESC